MAKAECSKDTKERKVALFVTRKRTAKLVVKSPSTTSTTRGNPKPQRTNMGNVDSTGRRSSKDRHQNVDFDWDVVKQQRQATHHLGGRSEEGTTWRILHGRRTDTASDIRQNITTESEPKIHLHLRLTLYLSL